VTDRETTASAHRDHQVSEEGQLGPTQDGTVMVDVGGDMGALVISTPVEMVRHEVEISRQEPAATRVHAAVRERLRRGRPPRYAVVFPSLAAGQYTVWRTKGATEAVATVVVWGGRVTETDWPAETKRPAQLSRNTKTPQPR
jgi:hypothetical protein